MCLLALHYRTLPEAPVLAAANREEYFDRPSLPPQRVRPQAGSSQQALCGLDARAGGTWLGVNAFGLLVAVTNRDKSRLPPAPRSRGKLCLELLACRTAAEAAQLALEELATNRYAGANYACLDARDGVVIHGGDRLEELVLEPGLHLLANRDLNDPSDSRLQLARELFQQAPIGSIAEFLPAAKRVCGHYVSGGRLGNPQQPSIVLRASDRGTVSSSLIALAEDRKQGVYEYAPGPPDTADYDDYSELLRGLR
ncbi:MAG TPA: NRDE family protein [Pirellulales bacterium]|nr:NRDE family protein [Pirellulales bacterium]